MVGWRADVYVCAGFARFAIDCGGLGRGGGGPVGVVVVVCAGALGALAGPPDDAGLPAPLVTKTGSTLGIGLPSLVCNFTTFWCLAPLICAA